MKKSKMIEYIDTVNDRFENARNHGNNGNNWWYPIKNTIAYNVKVYGGIDIADVRKHMTVRQNDYYSDEMLYEVIMEQQNDTAQMFSDDLDAEYGVKSGYAGRSGGWLEVTYHNGISEYYQGDWENSDIADIKDAYREAIKLDTLESKISEHIKTSLAEYKKYIESADAPKDVSDNLMTDEDIADIYKGKIKKLTDKLQ